MNLKNFIICILGMLLSINLPAQNFEGEDAKKIVPEAKTVQMGEQSSVPTFLVFEDTEQIPVAKFKSWEKTTFEFEEGISFETTKTKAGKNDMVHEYRQQYYHGIPIDYAISVVHSKNGKVTYVNGDIHDQISCGTTPLIENFAAADIATKHVGIDAIEWNRIIEEEKRKGVQDQGFNEQLNQELVIFPFEGKYYLAWKAHIQSNHFGVQHYVYTDAQNGKVISDIEAYFQCNLGTAVTTWRSNQFILTDQVGANFRLHNDCGNRNIRTRNIVGNADFFDADNQWNNNNALNRGARTAHFGVTAAWNYFSNTHQLDGIDGTGVVNVFVEAGLVNAGYAPNTLNITFGLGANNAIATDDFTTPDICGHEFAHGVFFNVGGVTNLNAYEARTLHEGVADIFGNDVQGFVDNGVVDWTHGDELDGNQVRSLMNPAVDIHPPGNPPGSPDTYMGNFWDGNHFHCDGGVIRFWFFLLSQGGSGVNDNGDSYNVQGITRQVAIDILFEAINAGSFGAAPTYFTARNATLQAAETLFGECSNQRRQVGNAWRAVGVGTGLPDLAMANLQLPGGTSIPEFSTFTVDYDITTNVNSSNLGSVYVGFYLRPFCSEWNIGSPFTVRVGGTCYNGTQTNTESITLPNNIAPGNYTLIAKADAFNWVSESSEWNNLACQQITVTKNNFLPDLRPTWASVSPSTVQGGNTFTATATLSNQGNANAGASYMCYYLSTDYSYSSNDIYLGNKYYGGVSAGGSNTTGKTLTIPSNTAPGTYYVVFRADCYNAVPESNESNNNVSRSITVTAAPSNLPDLIITNIDPSPSTGPPPTYSSWQTVNVTYNLTNQNAGVLVGASTTKIYVSTNNVVDNGDYLVSTAFNQTPGPKSANFTVHSLWPNGYYYILIVADANNQITEAFETNNVGAGHFLVGGFASPSDGSNDIGIDTDFANDRNFEGENLDWVAPKVFPNPTRDRFTVEYPIQTTPVAIQLVNGVGQIVNRYVLATDEQTGQWQYDGQQLPPGLYYIQWQTGDKVELLKLIVE